MFSLFQTHCYYFHSNRWCCVETYMNSKSNVNLYAFLEIFIRLVQFLMYSLKKTFLFWTIKIAISRGQFLLLSEFYTSLQRFFCCFLFIFWGLLLVLVLVLCLFWYFFPSTCCNCVFKTKQLNLPGKEHSVPMRPIPLCYLWLCDAILAQIYNN